MAEGCTFVASPFKPSHCKLCFQAKVDHKIPTLKAVTTKPVDHFKPVETKPVTSTPKSVAVDKPVETIAPTHSIPTDVPKSENVETTKVNKAELLSKFSQDKPAETKPEPKAAKTYKYQTNPQPAYTPPPTENKPKFAPITESVVDDSGAPVEEQPAPKKVFRPVGGVKMQGFDPSMLVKAAVDRRAKKNLDSGELEAATGTGVVEAEPEQKWEPTPLAESGARVGFGAGQLGGGLAALLQKRKAKEEAADALANPNSQAGEIVEEEVTLPSSPTMNKVFKKIEESPVVESPPESLPPVHHAPEPEPEPEVTETTTQQNNNDEDGDQDWS